MARSRYAILLCAIAALLSGCKQNNMQVDNDLNTGRYIAEATSYTLEETISKSNCAVIGEYVETLEFDTYVEHRFKVSKSLYGECKDEEIFLFCLKADVYVPEISYSYAKDASQYAKGQEYILITEQLESVFYEHDRYLLISDTFLPVDQEGMQRIYNVSLSDKLSTEEQSLESYIVSYKAALADSKHVSNDQPRYTRSSNMEEILDVTDYIVKARVTTLMAEGLDTPCATYYCKPLEVVYGEDLICNDNGMIGITVPLNTVTVGDTYYFLVNHVDDLSILYRVSSMNSVMRDDSAFINLLDQMNHCQ